MKKLLLQMLACGILTGTYAQNGLDNTKWSVKQNNLKTSTGRVVIENKTRGEWTIYFYKMPDNQYVTSYNHTNNRGVFVLQPGEYRITINDAEILNVPVQKGHDTELKVGLLDVRHNESWNLYDESGNRFVTSGAKPTLLLLPVGNYTLEAGTTKIMIPVGGTSVAGRQAIDAPQYIMMPIEGAGRLAIPASPSFFAFGLDFFVFITRPNGDTLLRCGFSPHGSCAPTKDLPEGKYKFHWVGNDYNHSYSPTARFIVDFQIKAGYETRFKMGFLKHIQNGFYITRGESGGGGYLVEWLTEIPLPIGQYIVKHMYVDSFNVAITQDKTTVVNSMTGAGPIQFVVKPASVKKAGSGRLKTGDYKMKVRIPDASEGSGYNYIEIDANNWIDLPPGNYRVQLNFMPVTVEIRADHETTLKTGFVRIKAMGATSWNIRPEPPNNNSYPGHELATIRLPIGYYILTMGTGKDYLLLVKEGETIEFLPDMILPSN